MPKAASKAQQRFLFAAARRGDLPRAAAERKAVSGPAFARLPAKVGAPRAKANRYTQGRGVRSIKRRVARRRGR